MRLTCPNCSARYEVDDSMVPAEGRDVQCSNCATTWFQPGRRTDRKPAAVHVERPADPPRADPPRADPPAATAPPVEEQPPLPPEPANEAAVEPPPDPSPPPPPPPPPTTEPDPPAERTGREIDPAVRSILLEEAEREARLRRGDPEPVETQEEMSLEDSDPSVERSVREQVAAAQEPDGIDDGPIARRDLLPDIEELNSTLRDTGDRSSDEDTTSDIDALEYGPQRRRGVRLGFLLVLLIAAAGAALYVNATDIGAAVPVLEGPLGAYASAIDSARFWLDGMARRLAGATDA